MKRANELCEPPLPGTKGSSDAHHLKLSKQSWLSYLPNWLDLAQGHELSTVLEQELPWQQRSIRLFGRLILEPRLVAWAGELPYRYSGQTLQPLPRPRCLLWLWARAEQLAGQSFNHVLINRYRDGNDKMGWHSDDEPELGRNPVICSISLGAPRRFLVKAKNAVHGRSPQLYRVQLQHGSALLMGGALQHHYRHSLPRQAGCRAQRINLTFRKLLWAPGAHSVSNQL